MSRFALVPVLALLLSSGCVGAKKYNNLQAQYDELMDRNGALDDQLRAMSAKSAMLDDQADRLASRANQLASENAELEGDVDELDRALRELRARQASAEDRVAAYQDLLKRFAALIDAGTLSVKVIDGRMVVNLPTDILFPSGSAQLSPEGKKQLAEVGAVFAGIDREFQIEGHTDTDPISTERFPSNWELASARATTVLRVLKDAGVPVTNLSTAGFADTRPVASNETAEGKKMNRRIEIAVLPDLSLMPGFDELERMSRDATADAN